MQAEAVTKEKEVVEVEEERPFKLFNRNFFLLWQGQTASQLGNQIFNIALALWVKQATNSATLMGLILMTASLPAVLLGPIGGVVADRYRRRRIIIFCDLLGGIIMLALAALMLAAPDALVTNVAALFVVAILIAIISTFFNPAINAAIPDLVPKDRVTSANALIQFSVQLSVFLGQGIGGTLFRLLGAPILYLINGITFLFSAISEFFIDIPQTLPEKKPTVQDSFYEFKHDIATGFRYIWREAGLRELVFISALLNFFMAPILLLLPFYVEDFLQIKPDWYGFLLATYGLGSILGFFIAGGLPLSGKLRGTLMLIFIILEPLGYVVLGLVLNQWAALSMTLLGGMMSGFVMVNITTLLQITTPSEMRGRIFGVLGTIAGALTPLAMGLSGVIADLTGQNIPLIYVSCGIIAAFLAAIVALNPDFRAYLAYVEKEEPQAESSISD